MLGFQPPAVGEEEIAAVAETLRSGWLTTGPRAGELERRMAEYLEAEHVLALASGTAALHLALVALGVGSGDLIILQGRARTYHAKQLAQEAVLDVTGGHAALANQIVVC